MSTTKKAAIHLGTSNTQNLEVNRNTNFEELQNFFPHHSEVNIASSSGDSACEND